MSDLSPGVRALLAAAKSDGPSAAARTSMWGAVSTATGVAATAATAGSSIAVGAAASSSKLLVVGALLGSALTLGVTLAVVRVDPGVMTPHRSVARETTEVARFAGERSLDEAQPIPLMIDTFVSSASSAKGEEALRVAKATGSIAPVHVASEDPLMREAALVSKARAALVRSDAEAALAALDVARRVGSRGLEPEELSLRARALRALGREAEAQEIEGRLRSRYPDHFLSR
jgi:hypothetical protein